MPPLEEIQAAFENRPVTVAAIDPEVVETAQVCLVDGIGRNVTRLSVPRTAQATATKLYLKEPQRLKATERIGDAKTLTSPLDAERTGPKRLLPPSRS